MKKIASTFGELFLDSVFTLLSIMRICVEFTFLFFWYVTSALALSIAMPFHIYEREVYMAKHKDVFKGFPKQIKRTFIVWLYSTLSFSSFILIAVTGMLPTWTLYIITTLQIGVYIYYCAMFSSFGGLYCPLFRSDELNFSAKRELERMHENVLEYRKGKS